MVFPKNDIVYVKFKQYRYRLNESTNGNQMATTPLPAALNTPCPDLTNSLVY